MDISMHDMTRTVSSTYQYELPKQVARVLRGLCGTSRQRVNGEATGTAYRQRGGSGFPNAADSQFVKLMQTCGVHGRDVSSSTQCGRRGVLGVGKVVCARSTDLCVELEAAVGR